MEGMHIQAHMHKLFKRSWKRHSEVQTDFNWLSSCCWTTLTNHTWDESRRGVVNGMGVFSFLFVNIHLSNSQSHHLRGVHTSPENNTQASAPGKQKLLANHFALLETLMESGFIVRKWWCCCVISWLQSVLATVTREILPPTVQGRACYANSEF